MPSPATIHEAVVEDAAALNTFMLEVFSEPVRFSPVRGEEYNETLEDQQKTIRGYAEQANSVYFLAKVDGEIVGELSLQGYPYKDLEHNATLGMSVHRNWRRQGIGRQLLEHSLAWATAHPVLKRIELWSFATNAAAISLYRSVGFVEEGVRQAFVCQDGVYQDDLMMACYL